MNAVRDFLADQQRFKQKLDIPHEISTVSGYLVDTTSPNWVTPPNFCNMNWSGHGELGGLLRTLQTYAASLLDGRSEATADSFYISFTRVSELDGWRNIASRWLTEGEINFSSMIGLKQNLFSDNPRTGWDYFSNIRRWYYWANGLRIPGFTDETVDRLQVLKGDDYIPFVTQDQVVPGRPKSKTGKNRRCYTDVDFARIQSALLHLEGRLNLGEVVLSTGRKFSSLPSILQANILKNSFHIGTTHLVLGWFACQFGDRPKAFSEVRESDFEFIEADGVKLGTVRFSEEIKRGYGRLSKPAKRAALPLNQHLVRLVPKLIEENRAWANKNGISADCDLPLFPAKRITTSFGAPLRMTLEDEGARYFRASNSLNKSLKALFGALIVKTSKETVIVPSFYSFRDGNHSRWTRKMPLESVAIIAGKKGTRSLNHYVKPGIRHLVRLDEVPDYTELAQALNAPVPMASIAPQARIPGPFPYAKDGVLRVGVEGGCGCFGGGCPMAFDGATDCYVCPSFTPVVEGPHEWTLKVLIDRKAEMIERGLPKSEWTRYDRHIAAVGRVIQLVQEWHLKHPNKENP